jgi:hypothetical protein
MAKKKISIHIVSTCECGHEYEEVLHVEDASFSLFAPPISLKSKKIGEFLEEF